MRLLRNHVRGLLPTLTWRWFGVGALQAYLSEGGSIETRVHIWHPGLVRAGITNSGDAHSHRFSFRSDVLCGELHDSPIDVETSGAGWSLFRVENARAAKARLGTHDGQLSRLGPCGVRFWTPRVFGYGASYEMERGNFHRTAARGVTVTLITKFDQNDTELASILRPDGTEIVHAFGGVQPISTADVLRDASGALS